MQCTWMCCPRFCPQVCSTMVIPISPPSQRGLATELQQGPGGRLEQQPVDQRGIALGDGVEFVGQGEDDMPVADVEQIGALTLDPPGLREGLALGAVTVPARGVLDRHRPAVVALRLEPAERGGATVHQRVDDPLLLGREPVCLGIGTAALAQDVRDLQRRPRGRRCVVSMGHRSGLGGTRELQQVQGRRGGTRLVVGQMQVAHGRADGAVPEAALNDVQLDSGLEEPGGVAIPNRTPGPHLDRRLQLAGNREITRNDRRAGTPPRNAAQF